MPTPAMPSATLPELAPSRLPAPEKLELVFTEDTLSSLKNLQASENSGNSHILQLLKLIDAQLASAFWRDMDIQVLVRTRAWAIEQLLLFIWTTHCPHPGISLIAAGGFGRGELHPHSDIDLLILLPEAAQLKADKVEAFIRALWDAGLNPGHSVRTVSQCIEDASEDVQFVTNLMEARIIDGDRNLYQQLKTGITAAKMWPTDTFFAAKMQEQKIRHEKYFDTAFNLEPNIKKSPGGLRDLQMIKWVTQRHFNTLTLHGLLEHDFLQQDEFQRLLECRNLIWRVRYALHLLAGRAEDRLTFEYQREIADKFGYTDHDNNLAVEQFMQVYYRNALRVERMNERLLQLFREELILDQEEDSVIVLDQQFQSRQAYLEIRQADIFTRRPSALLELFLVLQQHPEIKGIRATTIRSIRNHLHLIDDNFRADAQNYSIFMQLLSQQQGIYTQLQRMNRYGVLESFIPVFGKITGRMQYDLFHVYTVDQHTLFVIRNLRRFAYGQYRQRFPHGQAVYQRIPQANILYLAAFFHDIAKGRGGDHSTLGAVDADDFCRQTGLDKSSRELVVWLVRNHLLMSITAQRRDISDEDVLNTFTHKVSNRERLDALYLLTMADIAATSPKLWNGWKDSLLWQLYRASAHRIKYAQQSRSRTGFLEDVSARVAGSNPVNELAREFWASIPDKHLQRLSANQLAWATRMIITASDNPTVVAIRPQVEKVHSEVLIYTPNYQGLFASVIQVFDQMRLNILNARVLTTHNGYGFDIFQISNTQNKCLSKKDAERLQGYLQTSLNKRQWLPQPKQKQPSKFRYFDDRPELYFEKLEEQNVTRLELACLDQPGLLAHLSALFTEHKLILEDARIATFGHRVEDSFLLRNTDNQALSQQQQNTLKQAINQLLAEWD
ncbi:MAG: [protein-PII] uridylyltransferase [Xanthomonadales bacterium]|nr:[protein-PII] uridylyltransferase [Xanthomonadales bacterium]